MNLLLKLSELYDDEQFSDGLVLDFRSLEGTNSYCSEEAASRITEELCRYPLGGVHWIDTGDYHYVTALFLQNVKEPFHLALFDNHRDDQSGAFGDSTLSCGNWVSWLERNNPLMLSHSFNQVPACSGLPVYLSLDLDVLSPDFMRTNWDQGNLTLDELESLFLETVRNHRILAVDVCGGKTIAKGAEREDLSVNLETRERLKRLFGKVLPSQREV